MLTWVKIHDPILQVTKRWMEPGNKARAINVKASLQRRGLSDMLQGYTRSCKAIVQSYRVRLSCKAIMWGYRARLWYKAVVQGYRAKLSCEAIMQGYCVRLSCKAIVWGYHVRLWYKTVVQGCRVRLSCETMVQDCRTRLSCKTVVQGCRTRLTYKGVVQGYCTRLSYKGVIHGYCTRLSYNAIVQGCRIKEDVPHTALSLPSCSLHMNKPVGWVDALLYMYKLVHSMCVSMKCALLQEIQLDHYELWTQCHLTRYTDYTN